MALQLKDKEAHQRLNYLYQAAHCVLAQNPENVELARFYCFTQKTIARRLVLRQCERVKDGYISLMQLHAAACLTERDPSVKRTLCKRCCTLLVPGVTATTRQKRKQRKTGFTVVRCLSCGQTKSFQNNPDHCLWVERPEAQLEQQEQQDPSTSTKNQPNVSKTHKPSKQHSGQCSVTT